MGHYHYLLEKALLYAGFATLVLSAGQAATAQSVTLMWNANLERDIAGYRLYYGTAPHTYTQEIDVGNSMTATVSNLAGGSLYFLAVTAYNRGGFESGFSNAVTYAVFGSTPPPLSTPTPVPSATPNPTATPLITVLPASISFTAVAGGQDPAPQSIQVTTSNGRAWRSFDTSPWFDAAPTSGPSGTSSVVTPHAANLVAGTYSQGITFSALGLPDRIVVVTLTVTAAPPLLTARDDFNGADGDLGPKWTKDPAWGSGLSIFGKQVVAANAGVHYWNANSFAADQYSQIRLTGLVGSWSALFVRGNLRPGPYYMVTVRPGGAYLYASLNGVFVQLAQGSTAWTTGDVLRLEVQTVAPGVARLTVYQNGTDLFGYDDAEHFISSGQPGIGLHDGTGSMSLDDWEGGDIQ